jgi:hypothetical protein
MPAKAAMYLCEVNHPVEYVSPMERVQLTTAPTAQLRQYRAYCRKMLPVRLYVKLSRRFRKKFQVSATAIAAPLAHDYGIRVIKTA